MIGVLLCDDLLFASKVTTTARAQGLTVIAVRTPEQVLARAAEATCVIVDLHNAQLDLPALMAGLREACPRVIAFGSHVNTELLKAARAAGCEKVMPRSQFVAALETELAKWLESAPES